MSSATNLRQQRKKVIAFLFKGGSSAVSAREPYIPTAAICDAVRGRESEVLRALGIQWSGNSSHIRCPYPDHPDHEPSWRWDEKRNIAFCTCIGTRTNENKRHSIFGVVGAKEGVNFETAKMRVAEIIGRQDLIIETNGQKYQRTDAGALLNPPSENQNDSLAWTYLGHRLGTEPERVPRPTTKVVGLKLLAYFDPPQRSGGKPVNVGDYPAAIFETKDRDGKRHAHRIYLAPGGAGKAELGVTSDGRQRKPKKSARKTTEESTSGLAVIWGDPSNAETEIIFEGIETAAAAAFAFESEIASGKTMVAACITAGGVEAFKPWPAAKHIIVGADRDEALEDGRPPTRRGEIAARKFAALHHREVDVSIALPGKQGEKVDWLGVLRCDGVDPVRRGILAAEPYTRTMDAPDDGKGAPPDDDAEIARLAALSAFAYDRERESAATRLGCRVTTLDAAVRAACRKTMSTPSQGRPIELREVEVWTDEVHGAELLDDLTETIRRYIVISLNAARAIALWIIFTYVFAAASCAPKLFLRSAEKRSGKTRLLMLLGYLVSRPCRIHTLALLEFEIARQRQDTNKLGRHLHREEKANKSGPSDQRARFDQGTCLEKVKRRQEREADRTHPELEFPLLHEERCQRHSDKVRRQNSLALTQIGETTKSKQDQKKEFNFGLACRFADPRKQPWDDPWKRRHDCDRGHSEHQQIQIVIGKDQTQCQHRTNVIDEAGFGDANGFDGAAGRYRNLVWAKGPPDIMPPTAVLVRAAEALDQLKRDSTGPEPNGRATMMRSIA
jgi:hypothetical protein